MTQSGHEDRLPIDMISHAKTVRALVLVGLGCLIIVVLTHVAEAFHIFPSMGWGQPNSIGHYTDLVSAILGCVLLSSAILVGSSIIEVA
jgi:hypothetical protein